MSEAKIRETLASCPVAGDGVNPWLFTAALKFHRLGVAPARIEELLEEATSDCGRELKADEIPRAARNSAPGSLKARACQRSWPGRNYEQIEAVGLNGISLSELERHSPVQLGPFLNHTEAIIDALFPSNPLLCAGPSLHYSLTRSREAWRGFLARQQFIVPSPMSKTKGLTQDGKLSARSQDNVGPRRFLVIEFDFVETDKNGRDTAAAPMLRRLAAQAVLG